MLNFRWLLLFVGCCFGFVALAADSPDELKLMHIGNSFSQNSTQYLPELAKAGGKKITIFAAVKGGCSLQCHADLLQLAQQNKSEGSSYEIAQDLQSAELPAPGVSLSDALKAESWDIITVQQASRQSFVPASYEPHGESLIAQIKRDAPDAKILLHKTWAYHDGHRMFKEQQNKKRPVNHVDMHNKLTQAYNLFAAKYHLAVIPSADAMSLAYQQLSRVEQAEKAGSNTAEQAAAVNSTSSIKQSSNRLYSDDGAHLDVAGKYLTACVWYEVLFNDSVADVNFVPHGLDVEYARQLRLLAHDVVNGAAHVRSVRQFATKH